MFNITNMTKFVHLGCWNDLNTKNDKYIGNLIQVMEKMKSYIVDETPDFVVLAGDNYYPSKTKKEGSKKEKIISTKKLIDGFHSLPKNIEINMILGNHDLETNGASNSLFINNTDNPEIKNCYILNNEMRHILNRNEKFRNNDFKFVFFKEKMLTNGTLLLMLDTSMYTSAASKYLQCYSVFLRRPIESEQSLIDIQNNFIESTIQKYFHEIRHVILIGHHPIIGVKQKPDKSQKDKSLTYKENSRTNKDDHPKSPGSASKSNMTLLNDIPKFSDTLKIINNILRSKATYSYLCADLHLFQNGKVVMEDRMVINQFIVGTGGTKLDDTILEEFWNKEYTRESDKVVYKITNSKQEFGFLECVITDDVIGPVFKFISANTVNKGGRSTRKQRTRKRRSRNKKVKSF